MNVFGSSNSLVQESRTLALPSILISAKKGKEAKGLLSDEISHILMNDRLSFAVL
jgi:hypothetical protein